MLRKSLILLIIIAILTILVFPSLNSIYTKPSNESMTTTEKGKIIEIIPKDNEEYLKIKILTGKYKNKACILKNVYSNSDYYDKPFSKNDKVIIKIDKSINSKKPIITLSDYTRDTYELYLVILFLLLLIVIGKKQGLKSAITLIITALIIIKFMIPLILNGYNPIVASIVSCIVITILTIFIVTNISIKSVSTIIGTSFGVITAGIISFITGNLAHLSGLGSDEATSLMFLKIQQGSPFDFKGILFAGIIIGTLGAVMDVSMSIASSMNEIKETNPEINKIDLIKSGLNIGKDVMGTMTNTLILAYTGTSIPLFLVFMAKNTPLINILNTEFIATEIIRALSGSIGIVLSIPATSLISGILLNKK